LSKINCFYLSTDEYIDKATQMEKIDHDAQAEVTQIMSDSDLNPDLSGVTLNCFTETSSLMSDTSGGRTMSSPNFVTECFFLSHILLSFMSKRIEQFYMKNNEALNKAIKAKDYQ